MASAPCARPAVREKTEGGRTELGDEVLAEEAGAAKDGRDVARDRVPAARAVLDDGLEAVRGGEGSRRGGQPRRPRRRRPRPPRDAACTAAHAATPGRLLPALVRSAPAKLSPAEAERGLAPLTDQSPPSPFALVPPRQQPSPTHLAAVFLDRDVEDRPLQSHQGKGLLSDAHLLVDEAREARARTTHARWPDCASRRGGGPERPERVWRGFPEAVRDRSCQRRQRWSRGSRRATYGCEGRPSGGAWLGSVGGREMRGELLDELAAGPTPADFVTNPSLRASRQLRPPNRPPASSRRRRAPPNHQQRLTSSCR